MLLHIYLSNFVHYTAPATYPYARINNPQNLFLIYSNLLKGFMCYVSNYGKGYMTGDSISVQVPQSLVFPVMPMEYYTMALPQNNKQKM